ncbi:MAG: hypothetical protein R3E89_00330 [Thiolinea sp.]
MIHKLHTNKALTETDLQGLENTLIQIGEDEGKTLFFNLLERSETPSLAHFVQKYGRDGSYCSATGVCAVSARPESGTGTDTFYRNDY